MEVNFCTTCDNLMFLYEDEEESKLYLGCKACGEQKEYQSNSCIFSNKTHIDLSETINQNAFLEKDITLPSIKDNQNIKCTNDECISNKENKPSNIKYVKYEKDSMKYLYICTYCSQKWKN